MTWCGPAWPGRICGDFRWLGHGMGKITETRMGLVVDDAGTSVVCEAEPPLEHRRRHLCRTVPMPGIAACVRWGFAFLARSEKAPGDQGYRQRSPNPVLQYQS